MTTRNFLLTVYFDGLCPLCSREIEHYKKQDGHDKINFVDITEAQFDAAKEGVDPRLVHRVMHVKTASGELRTGVDAFIAIWQVLPKYHRLARLAQNSLLRPFLNLGYEGFTLIRPYLPRKSRDCEQSPYCELKK